MVAREAVVARKEVVVVIMAAAAAAWGAQGAGSAGEDRGVMVTVVGRGEEAMVKAKVEGGMERMAEAEEVAWQMRRQLDDGPKRSCSDCMLHSPRPRKKEFGTRLCDPRRDRRFHSDTCRYHPTFRPTSSGSRARRQTNAAAVGAARSVPRERPTAPVPRRISLRFHQSN